MRFKLLLIFLPLLVAVKADLENVADKESAYKNIILPSRRIPHPVPQPQFVQKWHPDDFIDPSTTETVPAPQPEPIPEPTAKPLPPYIPLRQIPRPISRPFPRPQPRPIPQPGPKPEPLPEPLPEPVPEPLPEPLPEPQPEPQPEPKREPQPETTPQPQPESEPIPLPDPRPLPRPVPRPATPLPDIKIPRPLPQPVPRPVPRPIPRPLPRPTPQPELTTTEPKLDPSFDPDAKQTLFPNIPTVSPVPRPIVTKRPIPIPVVTQKPIPKPVVTQKPIPKPVVTQKPIPKPTVTPKPYDPSRFNPNANMMGETGTPVEYNCIQDGFYSVNNECDSYIECYKRSAIKYICPDGLHFNKYARWPEYPCGYPSEVKCEYGSVNHEPQPTSQCPRQYGFFAMQDGDCSRYISCQEGLATIMNCPPGLAFNDEQSACDWPANVPNCRPNVFQGFTCPAAPINEFGEPDDSISKYRHGRSCKYYVACQRGHPRLLSCDEGLAFDEASETCINDDYVRNCEDSIKHSEVGVF